jgi:hypothetical protein
MLGGTETRLAPDILSKYVGTYEYSPGREATISLAGDLLFLQEGANPLKLPLAADSETAFVERTIGERMEFIKDAQGAVTGFIFHGARGDRKAIRKGNAVQEPRR